MRTTPPDDPSRDMLRRSVGQEGDDGREGERVADKVERLLAAEGWPPRRVGVTVHVGRSRALFASDRRSGASTYADRPRRFEQACDRQLRPDCRPRTTAQRDVVHRPAVDLVPAGDDDTGAEPGESETQSERSRTGLCWSSRPAASASLGASSAHLLRHGRQLVHGWWGVLVQHPDRQMERGVSTHVKSCAW